MIDIIAPIQMPESIHGEHPYPGSHADPKDDGIIFSIGQDLVQANCKKYHPLNTTGRIIKNEFSIRLIVKSEIVF